MHSQKVTLDCSDACCVWPFATPWTVAHQAPLSKGIFQERILEWVAISYSRGSSQPRDLTLTSYISCIDRWLLYHQCHLDSPNTGLLLLFSHPVISDSLWPQGLQHTRLPCPSASPGACSNSSLLSWWCHSTILSFAVPFSSCLLSSSSIRVFPNESVLCIRWPKYWIFSFSISPSSEYSGLIFFRIDWFDLLAVQGGDSQESSIP